MSDTQQSTATANTVEVTCGSRLCSSNERHEVNIEEQTWTCPVRSCGAVHIRKVAGNTFVYAVKAW